MHVTHQHVAQRSTPQRTLREHLHPRIAELVAAQVEAIDVWQLISSLEQHNEINGHDACIEPRGWERSAELQLRCKVSECWRTNTRAGGRPLCPSLPQQQAELDLVHASSTLRLYPRGSRSLSMLPSPRGFACAGLQPPRVSPLLVKGHAPSWGYQTLEPFWTSQPTGIINWCSSSSRSRGAWPTAAATARARESGASGGKMPRRSTRNSL